MVRPDTLVRARIDRVLDAAVERPLTVVQAGPGFGKTTSLAAWLAASGRPVAWLSLDAKDDDPRRLLLSIAAALGATIGPGALGNVERAVDQGADLELSCLPLLGEVLMTAVPERLVLVLDDYHVLRSAPVHELVRSVLALTAVSVPVLITSRTKPPLRLARRLAAREATLLTSAQLAFTPTETEALLNRIHRLGLSRADLTAVVSHTSGWPVGLSLLALALEAADIEHTGAGVPGVGVVEALVSLSAGQMVDYVVEEVMAQLPTDQRRLRLYTSVLDRINAALATALLGDPAAPALLEDWREQGQLVSSDGRAGGWLVLHDLVRTPLRVALEREEPGMSAVLHGRASVWFEANGMVEEAVHEAVVAGDGHRIDELLERHGLVLAMARRTFAVRAALNTAPAPDSELIPFRAALDLLVQFLDGVHQSGLTARTWELHERYVDRPEVRIVSSILVSAPMGGDMPRSIAAGREAIATFGHLPEFVIRVTPGIAACLMFEGEIAEARAMVEPLITSALVDPLGTSAREPARIFAHALLARACLTEGDPGMAEWHGRHAVELLEANFSDTTGDFVWIRAALADALRVNGRLADARAQLDRSLVAERQRPGSVIQGLLLVSDAELGLAEGRRARARTSAQRAREIFSSFTNVGTAVWVRLEKIEAELSAPLAQAIVGSMPTTAERRVLEILTRTSSRAVIANELFLSEATVKSHLRRIYRRLGVTSRQEALVAARARGLLDERRQRAGTIEPAPGGEVSAA